MAIVYSTLLFVDHRWLSLAVSSPEKRRKPPVVIEGLVNTLEKVGMVTLLKNTVEKTRWKPKRKVRAIVESPRYCNP